MGSTKAAAEQDFASDDFAHERLGSEAQPDSSNAGHPRGPAWNRRPINGDTGSVMGGAMPWPSLSESTRPITRSSSSDSSRPLSDGSAISAQAPLISQSSQIQSAHSNSSTNNSSRTRSRTLGGGSFGSGPPHNTFHRPAPPALPSSPGFDAPNRPSPPMPFTQRPGFGSSTRNTTSRRGNYGPRPRGGLGPIQNNYGGSRRHQERRDVNTPPQYMAPLHIGHMPPPPLPPGIPPFMTQSLFPVYPGQMGFEMASAFMYVPPVLPPEPYRSMPVVRPSPQPMLFPENTLTNRIVTQIDYYFSDDNLAKDNYLRSKMDDHGWVPVRLIASFHRVEQLSKDFRVILDALRHSTILELQDEKIRRRVTWEKWVSS